MQSYDVFLFKPLLYGIQFWPCDQSYDTQLGFVHTFFCFQDLDVSYLFSD
jgi:hypothetical protein